MNITKDEILSSDNINIMICVNLYKDSYSKPVSLETQLYDSDMLNNIIGRLCRCLNLDFLKSTQYFHQLIKRCYASQLININQLPNFINISKYYDYASVNPKYFQIIISFITIKFVK